MNALQRLAKLASLGRAKGELLDGVEAIADALERAQRTQQPGAEQSSAHRRDRSIDLVQQRSLRTAFAAGHDLEVFQRDRIDDEAVAARAIADGAHVGEVGLLRVSQIADERAGGLDRGLPAFQSEAFESVRLELIEECAPRGFGFEAPPFRRRDRGLHTSQRHDALDDGRLLLIVRDDNFARPQHGHFVRQCLESRGALVFRRAELPGREVDQRRAEYFVLCAGRGDRHQKCGLACLQIAAVRERAR